MSAVVMPTEDGISKVGKDMVFFLKKTIQNPPGTFSASV